MQTIPLYTNATELARHDAPEHVHTLDIYEPFGQSFTDAAVVILPGGGYGMLSSQEGEGYAGIFQLWGFKTFVCNYRMGEATHAGSRVNLLGENPSPELIAALSSERQVTAATPPVLSGILMPMMPCRWRMAVRFTTSSSTTRPAAVWEFAAFESMES